MHQPNPISPAGAVLLGLGTVGAAIAVKEAVDMSRSPGTSKSQRRAARRASFEAPRGGVDVKPGVISLPTPGPTLGPTTFPVPPTAVPPGTVPDFQAGAAILQPTAAADLVAAGLADLCPPGLTTVGNPVLGILWCTNRPSSVEWEIAEANMGNNNLPWPAPEGWETRQAAQGGKWYYARAWLVGGMQSNPTALTWALIVAGVAGAGYAAWKCTTGIKYEASAETPEFSIRKLLTFEGCFKERPWIASMTLTNKGTGDDVVVEKAFSDKKAALSWLDGEEERRASVTATKKVSMAANPSSSGHSHQSAASSRSTSGAKSTAPISDKALRQILQNTGEIIVALDEGQQLPVWARRSLQGARAKMDSAYTGKPVRLTNPAHDDQDVVDIYDYTLVMRTEPTRMGKAQVNEARNSVRRVATYLRKSGACTLKQIEAGCKDKWKFADGAWVAAACSCPPKRKTTNPEMGGLIGLARSNMRKRKRALKRARNPGVARSGTCVKCIKRGRVGCLRDGECVLSSGRRKNPPPTPPSPTIPTQDEIIFTSMCQICNASSAWDMSGGQAEWCKNNADACDWALLGVVKPTKPGRVRRTASRPAVSISRRGTIHL